MKDIAKTALVLSIIAIIAGVLLGGVNQFTYMTEEERAQRNLAKAYTLDEGDVFKEISAQQLAEFAPETSAGTAEIIAAYYVPGKNIYIYQTVSKGYASGLTLMIAVEDNLIVNIVKVAGGETIAKPFSEDNYSKYYGIDLTQVEGFRTTDTKYNKDNTAETKVEIVAVTGATMSSNAICYGVDIATGYHKNLVAADFHLIQAQGEGGVA